MIRLGTFRQDQIHSDSKGQMPRLSSARQRLSHALSAPRLTQPPQLCPAIRVAEIHEVWHVVSVRSERVDLTKKSVPARFVRRAFSVGDDQKPTEKQRQQNACQADVKHLHPRIDVDL